MSTSTERHLRVVRDGDDPLADLFGSLPELPQWQEAWLRNVIAHPAAKIVLMPERRFPPERRRVLALVKT